MDSAKKQRAPKVVYSPEEEDWLVTNALEYSSIIENKKTDGATNREKEQAWEEITSAFNVAPPGKERSLKSLREKYIKIKQYLRDRAFGLSSDAKTTESGLPKKELEPLSEPMQQLSVLLDPSTLARPSPLKCKPLNALLQNPPRTSASDEMPNKKQRIHEGVHDHSLRKQKIEIEILSSERERCQFERERAVVELKRAAAECERAELERERAAVELQRSEQQLRFEQEIHQIRLANLQTESDAMQPIIPTVNPTASTKKKSNKSI